VDRTYHYGRIGMNQPEKEVKLKSDTHTIHVHLGDICRVLVKQWPSMLVDESYEILEYGDANKDVAIDLAKNIVQRLNLSGFWTSEVQTFIDWHETDN